MSRATAAGFAASLAWLIEITLLISSWYSWAKFRVSIDGGREAMGRRDWRHTGVAGLRDDLGEKLGEVGNILAKEGGLENKSLTGVVRVQLATEELGLSRDAEGGTLVRVLYRQQKISSVDTHDAVRGIGKLDLESKLLQTDGQAGQSLVPSASLDDDGQLRGRALGVSRGDLEAGGIVRLERLGARRGGREAPGLVGARSARGPEG